VAQAESTSREPAGLVLALGGGGAPGIAHIGVLQGLADNGIPVRAVVGTSVGAEVGAFYAAGMPPAELIELATRFDWRQTAQLFLPDLPVGGLVSGARIMDFLRQGIGTKHIEELAVGFAAVAADLESGEEVVIDRGELVEAVRASISIPGLMAPHRYEGRVLVDGGVLNPLPADVARRRFGGPVVAVAVHAGARYAKRMPVVVPEDTPRWVSHARQLLKQPWVGGADGLRAWLEARLEGQIASRSGKPYWTAWRVLDRVYAMAQTEIVRLRAARAPADLTLAPAVGDIGLLEFYRAREAIAAGRRAVEEDLPRLRALLHPEGS
jgi:NTE family protein